MIPGLNFPNGSICPGLGRGIPHYKLSFNQVFWPTFAATLGSSLEIKFAVMYHAYKTPSCDTTPIPTRCLNDVRHIN